MGKFHFRDGSLYHVLIWSLFVLSSVNTLDARTKEAMLKYLDQRSDQFLKQTLWTDNICSRSKRPCWIGDTSPRRTSRWTRLMRWILRRLRGCGGRGGYDRGQERMVRRHHTREHGNIHSKIGNQQKNIRKLNYLVKDTQSETLFISTTVSFKLVLLGTSIQAHIRGLKQFINVCCRSILNRQSSQRQTAK